jgi:hypothetical protein
MIGVYMKKALIMIGALAYWLQASEVKACDENRDASYSKTGKEALEGFYIAAGIVQSASTNEAENVSHSYETTRFTPTNVGHVGNFVLGELSVLQDFAPYSVSKITTKLAANQWLTGVKAEGSLAQGIVRGKSNRLGGSLGIGYGRFVHHDVYLGAELLFDVVGNKEKKSFNKIGNVAGLGNVYLKQSGFIPSFAARVGMYCDSLGALIYGKFGLSNSRAELTTESRGDAKLSKIVPVLGIGAEKKVDFVSIRFEVDCRLQGKKTAEITASPETVNITSALGVVPPMDLSHKINVGIKSRGYEVRLMAVMHI